MKIYAKATFEYLYEIDTKDLDNPPKTLEDAKTYFEENKGDLEEELMENYDNCVEEQLLSFNFHGIKK